MKLYNYEYTDLIEIRAKYKLLKCILLDNAALSYDGKGLRFNDELISSVLSIIEKDIFYFTLKKLIKEQEEKENDVQD